MHRSTLWTAENPISAFKASAQGVTRGPEGCHDKGIRLFLNLKTTQLLAERPKEDTLIDALRGCRTVQELKGIEQRLSTTDAIPLFDWICDLLVQRRISRGLAARLLSQLHNG